MKMKVVFVLGTRPEGIKLAPVIRECQRRDGHFDIYVINTGQHQELLRPILDFFEVPVHFDLQVMTLNQTLASLTSVIIDKVDAVYHTLKPNLVIVQGDTTTALSGALAAFYRRIPIAHVEAGLRTDNLNSPFPEELNRRIISQTAGLHFAATELNKAMLERDALPVLGGRIVVTGNTVIDALYEAVNRLTLFPQQDPDLAAVQLWKREQAGRRMILVTGHRRENFGEPFEKICLALREIGLTHRDVLIVFPVHLNPSVQNVARKMLAGAANVRLVGPKNYPTFVSLMLEAELVITDSGGVQEEAPALGKPVLVTRTNTERPEGIEMGIVKMVGTDHARILALVNRLLSDRSYYARTSVASSPYGDGKAAKRIIATLLNEPVEEFRSLSQISRLE